MNPLLDQFISEALDFLQGIGEKLMQLESEPDSSTLMNELFRMVHTLKGNSGLFEFPEMTRVLHAGEDLLDAVRDGRVPYSQALADHLLEAMDFVLMLLDEIESAGSIGATHAPSSARLAENLRSLLPVAADETESLAGVSAPAPVGAPELPLADLPEELRMALYRAALTGDPLSWVEYAPDAECFFKGEDPLYQVGQVPEVVWREVLTLQPWPKLAELDAYRCQLVFRMLSVAEPAVLHELFRYMPHETRILAVSPIALVLPTGDPNGGPVYEDFVADAIKLLDNGDLVGLERVTRSMLELSAPKLWLASALRWLLLILEMEPGNSLVQHTLIESLRTLSVPRWGELAVGSGEVVVAEGVNAASGEGVPSVEDAAALAEILSAQHEILALQDDVAWLGGRLRAVAATLAACCSPEGKDGLLDVLEEALENSLADNKAAPLLNWLDEYLPKVPGNVAPVASVEAQSVASQPVSIALAVDAPAAGEANGEPRFCRRAEDAPGAPKTLKVDQTKIDRLMNLIGEMVVAKNSLPYLAARAEGQYGVRELAREIKTQYAVVNRIAEEMQDAIMQVRMMPVSFIFQRFPRLVRDTSRKLGKEVNLVLEGEATEADKNIVEALADPLIHIVRNSLDHGIELPAVRLAAGKPAEGKLTIRASQAADRVVIEIIDDGKGIDPEVIKQKAYEKGIIDEATLERISDQEAVNLVFAAGFSTVEVVSDLSGRGVGMDVVRNAVEKVNGTVSIDSEKGRGTVLRLSLPLSMAVTNVMIVESDRQIFGVPMDMVVETVRVPRAAIRHIKQRRTTVLRGSIVPLLSLNELLAIGREQRPNDDDEFATLVIRHQGENVGIVVDDFREAVDIILKPMAGILGGLAGYSGSALLGDGTVLMVLNPRELA
jgi:two-component system, chemotaxis family, sensor kinase CheA